MQKVSMGSQRRSESSSSEHERDNSHESDSSGDFKVLNVSKKINKLSDSPRSGGPIESYSPNPEQAGIAEPSTTSLDTPNCVKSTTIGGSKLEEWICSVRKGRPQSDKSLNFTKMIRKNKNFHNPAIFAKMISYCNINEFGTQFKNRTLKKGDFYADIADVQDFCMKGSS